ncbi:hypothetical protein HDV06_000847 [Boothiomyces sp. JEL0866]|nr:hypothetical protein HDV06_000838 [Boothiomyces sp. JEL0866]KAJ3318079.1 hypothetical protein HDV06_000847 [Boothiomyces sp. JEL0866]
MASVLNVVITAGNISQAVVFFASYPQFAALVVSNITHFFTCLVIWLTDIETLRMLLIVLPNCSSTIVNGLQVLVVILSVGLNGGLLFKDSAFNTIADDSFFAQWYGTTGLAYNIILFVGMFLKATYVWYRMHCILKGANSFQTQQLNNKMRTTLRYHALYILLLGSNLAICVISFQVDDSIAGSVRNIISTNLYSYSICLFTIQQRIYLILNHTLGILYAESVKMNKNKETKADIDDYLDDMISHVEVGTKLGAGTSKYEGEEDI